MNDSKCAAKLRAQLKRFLGELLPHFSRPKVSFLGDMTYGLMTGGDVKLSSSVNCESGGEVSRPTMPSASICRNWNMS